MSIPRLNQAASVDAPSLQSSVAGGAPLTSVVGVNSMSSDFIIVPRPPAAPKDTSPVALAQEWFASIRGMAPETVARLREQVQGKLESGACHHLVPATCPVEHQPNYELQRCVEQVLTECWDSLKPEERLLTRFPTVQAIGEYFDIPKRGRALIIRRELTPRFGVEMVFQLQDGSFFTWEFID